VRSNACMCPIQLFCFLMTSMSISLLLLHYYFHFAFYLWPNLESIGPVFIDIVWEVIPVF
jgi:hypothetical protein